MPSRLVAVAYDTHDPATVADFWASVLGRETRPEPDSVLVPGDQTQVGLRFVRADADDLGSSRLHLHLTSAQPGDQERTIEAILRLGGRHIDVGQAPDADFVVMADPGGNELCVIEPRNGFLAGTGFLGEVTCEGTREVGLFWRDTLGWPLVWDQDGETAVQSPHGGTKVSWGGPPVAPQTGHNRERFDLETPDVRLEADRLVALGATVVDDARDEMVLADPDGTAFGLRRGYEPS